MKIRKQSKSVGPYLSKGSIRTSSHNLHNVCVLEPVLRVWEWGHGRQWGSGDQSAFLQSPPTFSRAADFQCGLPSWCLAVLGGAQHCRCTDGRHSAPCYFRRCLCYVWVMTRRKCPSVLIYATTFWPLGLSRLQSSLVLSSKYAVRNVRSPRTILATCVVRVDVLLCWAECLLVFVLLAISPVSLELWSQRVEE